ncbi:hypothetical protein RB195_011959 [Necator americanus]|uniref:Uncharacterized protein n=1 Tax=Necator americanus TaxID=51031 RepID=A0ABR1D4U1_NECAM
MDSKSIKRDEHMDVGGWLGGCVRAWMGGGGGQRLAVAGSLESAETAHVVSSLRGCVQFDSAAAAAAAAACVGGGGGGNGDGGGGGGRAAGRGLIGQAYIKHER